MSVDDLIGKMDAKCGVGGWDIYRSAMKEWIVRVDRDVAGRGESLLGAILDATNYTPVVVIPERPRMIDESHCTYRKSGSRWVAETPLGTMCNLPSKTKAREAVQRMLERIRKSQEEWDAQYRARPTT